MHGDFRKPVEWQQKKMMFVIWRMILEFYQTNYVIFAIIIVKYTRQAQKCIS